MGSASGLFGFTSEAITPAWLTAALADACPGVQVSDVSILEQHSGTTGRARFGVRYAAGDGNRDGLERAIVEFSLRFHVLSRFTAYVAVDRSQAVNPGGALHQVVQPVEMPEGWVALEERHEAVVACRE